MFSFGKNTCNAIVFALLANARAKKKQKKSICRQTEDQKVCVIRALVVQQLIER